MTRTAAIVGGGYSGLLTAIHLLAADPYLTVRLVERAPSFARGRAYATDHPEHVLNVRAANMSAFPARPTHFVEWLTACGEASDGFVGRGLYGDYLQELLRDAVRTPGRAGRLLLEQDEVSAIRRTGGRYRVELELGRSFAADAAILAIGLTPPAAAPGIDPGVRAAPGFVADPWAGDLRALPDGEILLLGSGLTMVDVALAAASPVRRFVALSRRGLLARVHAETPSAPAPDDFPASPSRALRILRRHALAVGWRAAVDGVRPLTAKIWGAWSMSGASSCATSGHGGTPTGTEWRHAWAHASPLCRPLECSRSALVGC